MPHPSLSPGRAGGVVPRLLCWPKAKAAWRPRLLATALQRVGRPTSLLSTTKPVLGVCSLGLATMHVAAQSTAALRGTDSLVGASRSLVSPAPGQADYPQFMLETADGATCATLGDLVFERGWPLL